MYLDTACLKDINECLKTGVFQGVTTNPTILLQEEKNRTEQIKDILRPVMCDTKLTWQDIMQELFNNLRRKK